MRKIKQLVVHCTASPDHIDFGFKDINAWHKKRGWMSPSGVSCGYHYIIRRNGTIERGRPDKESGAHARGVNSTSIGIVWVGLDQMSAKQKQSLISLLHFLSGKYNIDIDNVLGHREAVKTDKTCPNIDMNLIRAEMIFNQPGVKIRRD